MSKIMLKPEVYLIGKQTVVRHELQRFLNNNGVAGWTTDAPSAGEEMLEIGGRLCYMSFAKPRPGGNKGYVDHIKETGHGSVTEHAVYTLIIEGVSRTLTHEFVRHRVGMSPSQLSQRYVDESDTAFVVPPDLKVDVLNSTEAGQIWIESCEKAKEDYIKITTHLASKDNKLTGTEKRKYARQAARSVLPNATETKIQMTGTARAWRNFIELRASRHAEPEIRILAHMVWQKLNEESPNLFGDYSEEKLEDGTFELTTPFRKV